MKKSKFLAIIVMIISLYSCGSVRFDINGVDHERLIKKTAGPGEYTPYDHGCYGEADCDGQKCIIENDVYPGKCINADQLRAAAEAGCTSDSECGEGRICATVKGEYPGSCASTGGGALLIGAAILGAAAVMANEGYGTGGGSVSRGAAAEPAPKGNYQGCCSYHNGVNSCGGTKIICNDGWTSGCDC
jgi:hypothetical protein